MSNYRWITVILLQAGYADVGQAIYCIYQREDGQSDHTYCTDECCDGEQNSYANTCCRYMHEKEVYIGAGITCLFVVSIFILCLVYVFCKKKLLKHVRQSANRHHNSGVTASNPSRSTVLPTVSLHVEPPVPPPYEVKPPPYYPTLPSYTGSIDSGQQLGSALPDEPPPPYTLHHTRAE